MPETVVITGSNRGIGLALVKAFLKQDHPVMATCRQPHQATELKELAEADPDHLKIFQMDLEDPAGIESTFYEISTLTDHIDVLVNNAAVFPEEGDEPFEELNLDWFTDAVRVNVTGTARVTRAALPLLRKSARARIVNISSGAGSISDKQDALHYCYGTSKAALNMFTRTLASELKAKGMTVTAISPGWVKTDMGGPNAELTTDQSAAELYQTITSLTLEHSGCFLGRDGSTGGYHW
jgi:NAD(P)-dependent dehydrogenase (short-subunit alcohol dehydrogenase family)